MSSDTEIELHSKRFSDFHVLRLIRASKYLYDEPITAYLSDVFIHSNSAVGIVFGHIKPGPYGRFSDGHFLRTSDIRSARKEGRFWVLTTMNSRYVIASFKKGDGRASFKNLLQSAPLCYH
ncbi:hypothetical protein PS880_01231 [Pseudomonas fluorescens]|uniref:Uncharacterized protein n=1 Tax=Pseudomonas fluorescens TaxID=294 RepID=A0A5E7I1I6_PSEFL|nr:hypothetical protein PS880_01231 [Pseudomonas fluorescens]